MTEKEAVQRICPASFTMPSGPTTCYGSGCMAWRLQIETLVMTDDGAVPLRKGGPHGYCGLVGNS